MGRVTRGLGRKLVLEERIDENAGLINLTGETTQQARLPQKCLAARRGKGRIGAWADAGKTMRPSCSSNAAGGTRQQAG